MPYLNVRQVESALLTAARPPNHLFTELITLPNLTWEGRTCRALKIAKGSDSERMGIYFIGGVHAREWGSPDILIYFIQRLTRAYRTNSDLTLGSRNFTAAQIQNIVDNLDVFIFPQVNPDGRNYSMTGDPNWRKNRRLAPSSNPDCLGVDINRNYDFLWNYPTYFHPEAPVRNSTDPCDYQVYIGPSAASEPETQNVVSMLDSHPNIRLFVDVHSYGEAILYGWGDDQEQVTNSNMNFQNVTFNGQRGIADDDAYREYIDDPDQDFAIDLANRMRDAIRAVRGRTYEVKSSFELYPTAGTSTDFTFSRHLADASNGKVYSYTIEWGSRRNATPFHPPYSEMQKIIREVTAGLLDSCLSIIELTQVSVPSTVE
jgi:carboxypeptidase T